MATSQHLIGSCFGRKEQKRICSQCQVVMKGGTAKCKACTENHNTKEPTFGDHIESSDAPGKEIKGQAQEGSFFRRLFQSSHANQVKFKTQGQAEKMKKEYNKIKTYCRKKKCQFVDDSFPPAPVSLYVDHRKKKYLPANKEIHWKRPQDMVSNVSSDDGIPWTVFRTATASDICQGSLGNCWFLSALAILAEKPELLERIIVTTEICEDGVYQVRLCKDGQWQTVLIDDMFPCYQSGQLAYSYARRKQLWVPLIEKAFAKVHGSYEALIAGRCVEALAYLTGAPCSRIKLQPLSPGDAPIDQSLLWAELMSSKESGFLMGASCGSKMNPVNQANYKSLGLVPDHAYSVLDVQECEGHRLVRLRNPWGRFSWKGDWSDKSRLWMSISQKKKDDLMPCGNEEGIFWMCFKDFIRYFKVIEVCKYKRKMFDVRFRGKFPMKPSDTFKIYNMAVSKTTEVEFGLFQEKRGRGENSDSEVMDLCVLVFRKGKKRHPIGEFVGYSQRQVRHFVGCSRMLERGDYVIVCAGFNHFGIPTSEQPEYSLVIHSSKPVSVKPHTRPEFTLADSLIQLALAEGKHKKKNEDYTVYSVCEGWEGVLFVVENVSTDKSVHIQYNCSKSRDMMSTRGSILTSDVVPPRHRQVVLSLSSATSGYQIEYDWRVIQRPADASLGEDWAPGNAGSNHLPEITAELLGLHAPRPID